MTTETMHVHSLNITDRQGLEITVMFAELGGRVLSVDCYTLIPSFKIITAYFTLETKGQFQA